MYLTIANQKLGKNAKYIKIQLSPEQLEIISSNAKKELKLKDSQRVNLSHFLRRRALARRVVPIESLQRLAQVLDSFENLRVQAASFPVLSGSIRNLGNELAILTKEVDLDRES